VCGELGHKSNECPKMNQVNMTDYEDDKEEEFEIEKLNDFDFANQHRESATCIVQILLCNQKVLDLTQRYQVFYLRYSVKSKVCILIIDNESCKNIISRALVDYLKIDETTPSSLHC